jgi:hypothetical protein
MSKQSYKWEFVIDLKGVHKGFNNPDLERFKNGRYRSLTREVIQNSIDAQLNSNVPVRVEFECVSRKTKDIPDKDGLLKKIEACIPMAKQDKGRKEALTWFNAAKGLLEGNSLDVLRMSDYNTVGMAGPCEYGKPYYAYMKAMGESVKNDANAAGSHGIGKRAPLLSSKLRTLFVSTRYSDKESNEEQFLTQGFSILISHQEERAKGKKVTIDNEGYWGETEGLMPSSDPNSIPEWMQRKAIGTDIHLLAFDKAPNWQDKMVGLIMTNYFAAFARGTLEVKVQDTEISNSTINSLFMRLDHFENCLDEKQEAIHLRLARHFYEVLDKSNMDVKTEQAEIVHLGLVEMRILVREGLPQEYAVIRANMLIMTDLPDLKRFPNYKDFVAVIECKSAEGEALLRSIEPSRHDNFEIDQLESESEKRRARVAVSKLSEFIRKSLKKHAQEITQQAGSVDFLSQFLADDTVSGADSGEFERDPAGKILITPKKISFKSDKVRVLDDGEGSDGGAGGKDDGGGEGGDGGGGESGEGKGGAGGKKGDPMKNFANAARVIETNTGRHSLNFSIQNAGTYKVSVRAVGLDSEESLPITESSKGKIEKGCVIVEAQAQSRVSLSVLLSRPSLGSYRLVCEELPK